MDDDTEITKYRHELLNFKWNDELPTCKFVDIISRLKCKNFAIKGSFYCARHDTKKDVKEFRLIEKLGKIHDIRPQFYLAKNLPIYMKPYGWGAHDFVHSSQLLTTEKQFSDDFENFSKIMSDLNQVFED